MSMALTPRSSSWRTDELLRVDYSGMRRCAAGPRQGGAYRLLKSSDVSREDSRTGRSRMLRLWSAGVYGLLRDRMLDEAAPRFSPTRSLWPCRKLGLWRHRDAELSVRLSLSPRNLRRRDQAAALHAAAARAGPAKMLSIFSGTRRSHRSVHGDVEQSAGTARFGWQHRSHGSAADRHNRRRPHAGRDSAPER